MTRIFVQPEWVGVLDFETRAPSAVERAARRVEAEQPSYHRIDAVSVERGGDHA